MLRPGQPFQLLRLGVQLVDAIAQARPCCMNLAWADAAVEYFLTLQEMEDHPRRHDIAYRSASGQLQASHNHIQRRLRQTISTLGRTMLETTTIDPGTTHGGALLAEQIVIPDGMVRDMVIEVRFGGFPHPFRLNLAPWGTYAPTPVDITAVPPRSRRS